MVAAGFPGGALIKGVAGPRKTDPMSDFVPALLTKRGKVVPFYSSQEWYDVGKMSSLERVP